MYDNAEFLDKNADDKVHVSIEKEMLLWVSILIAAFLIKVYMNTTNPQGGIGFLDSIANFILFTQWSAIIPLVIGALIGAKIGRAAGSIKDAIRAGILNGAYACAIYGIAILVVYAVMSYSVSSLVISQLFFVYFWLLAPILTMMASTVAFSALSYARN
jgi:hypothetical protein